MLKYYEQKKGKKEMKNKDKSKFINNHIFNHQFKLNFKSLLTWSIIVSSLMILVLALYPMVAEMFETLPAEMLEIMEAMGSGSFENIAEYYVIEGGQIYVLVGAIYAAMLGINLIKREIADGSAEFLYTQPVTKSSTYRSKLLTLLINVFIFNIIVTTVSFVTMVIVQGAIDFNLTNFLLYSLLATIIHLQVGFITFAITGIIKKNSSIGFGLGFAVLTYFFSIISQLSADVKFLKYASPFTYVAEGVMATGFSAVNSATLIGWSILTIMLLAYSHYYFKRSDIL